LLFTANPECHYSIDTPDRLPYTFPIKGDIFAIFLYILASKGRILEYLMRRVLILFAHPRFEKSRVNRSLLSALPVSESITLHDLYERYPDYNIDVETEKQLLIAYDVLIWHHPFYMFSAPAILKQWMDLVLEYGWAHGGEGDALKNKTAFNVVTTGGSRESYTKDGFNRFTIREFLRPFEQTARLCKMTYLPPFAVHGTYRLTGGELLRHAEDYASLLQLLSGGLYRREEMERFDFLNDWLADRQREGEA
jgi:glutathione-regulated potassium-efflux system ancillary protein KefG